MGIGFLHAFYRVYFGNHNLRQSPFVIRADKEKNIRLSKTGMSLLDSTDALERLKYVLRPSCLDLDQYVGLCCHRAAPFMKVRSVIPGCEEMVGPASLAVDVHKSDEYPALVVSESFWP